MPRARQNNHYRQCVKVCDQKQPAVACAAKRDLEVRSALSALTPLGSIDWQIIRLADRLAGRMKLGYQSNDRLTNLDFKHYDRIIGLGSRFVYIASRSYRVARCDDDTRN